MVALVEALVPYVPPLVARRHVADPAAPAAPAEERFPAAILFADVSGFTSLARRLAERGPAGAERLSAVINGYFAQLLDVLSAHGGEVVAFAGDATARLTVVEPRSGAFAAWSNRGDDMSTHLTGPVERRRRRDAFCDESTREREWRARCSARRRSE